MGPRTRFWAYVLLPRSKNDWFFYIVNIKQSKRQLHGKTAGNLNGRKAAEALACAASNHERAGWFTDVQEIFGIAIIHTSFEFYHMLLPR